jgi:hypothetical protein
MYSLPVRIRLGAESAPESPALSSLMTEVHELRLAIERSTLLGARTQIAIQRLQTQEARVTSSAKALEDARKELSRFQEERVGLGYHQRTWRRG